MFWLKIVLFLFQIFESIFLAFSNFNERYEIHKPTLILLHLSVSIYILYSFSSFMTLLIFLTINGVLHKMGNSVKPGKLTNLKNKLCLITGVAENGIGFYLTKGILENGAKVIITCRDMKKSEKLVQDLKNLTKNNDIVAMELNLDSLESVKSFIQEFRNKYDRLDVLFNNGTFLT
jgi:hypothetical protein